jgi:hypothetical protein
MNKRGISGVIVTILMILLAIAAIILVWAVLKNVLQKSASDISSQCLTLDLEIAKVEKGANTIDVYVRVKRNPGEGNLTGVRFKFTSSNDSFIRDKNVSMKELEIKTFNFSDVGNVSFISKVEIAGIVSFNNDEKICRIADSSKVMGVYVLPPAQVCGNNIKEGAEECDGSDLGGQTCQSKGYYLGSLVCVNCVINDSGCSGRCPDGTCDSGYENSTNCPADCLVSSLTTKTYLPNSIGTAGWWKYGVGIQTLWTWNDVDGVGGIYPAGNYTAANLDTISSNNADYVAASGSPGGDNHVRYGHRFRFNISETISSITNITVMARH